MQALYPHVLTKNCRIEVNFGQAHNPYFSILPGYKFIGNTPPEARVSGTKAPLTKQECEVIMMVGLPGVGMLYHIEQSKFITLRMLNCSS